MPYMCKLSSQISRELRWRIISRYLCDMFFSMIFFIKANVIDTYLKSLDFIFICFDIIVDNTYPGCNLKCLYERN